FCISACNRQQPQLGSGREDSYSVLEAQHAELKRREVEEEILLKSGEIRVLRDSLKAAQQEKEAQRQNQILLDTQRQKEQRLSIPGVTLACCCTQVQSLQTELQFKEAEINEMKTKLHNSDRNKLGSPPARSRSAILNITSILGCWENVLIFVRMKLSLAETSFICQTCCVRVTVTVGVYNL
uniref:Uncharacterized protein n=1 Tax=Salarias fasciatus TaxID=181472 RepID=A0A672JAA5_SALFA